MNSPYFIEPLKEKHARDMLDWRYPEPYDFYDPPRDNAEGYVRELTRRSLQFHAVIDRREQMVGFCSYGIDGQVQGGDYSVPALDIGLGMKPEYTGQGFGLEFFCAILSYGIENKRAIEEIGSAVENKSGHSIDANQIRLTVATFNCRAMVLYRKFGFEPVYEFKDTRSQVEYRILLAQTSEIVSISDQIMFVRNRQNR